MRICLIVTFTWGIALILDIATWALFFTGRLLPAWMSTARVICLR